MSNNTADQRDRFNKNASGSNDKKLSGVFSLEREAGKEKSLGQALNPRAGSHDLPTSPVQHTHGSQHIQETYVRLVVLLLTALSREDDHE